MLDTYNNIEEYKLRKKGFHEDGLIVFHDMVADMINNKSLNPIFNQFNI